MLSRFEHWRERERERERDRKGEGEGERERERARRLIYQLAGSFNKLSIIIGTCRLEPVL